MKNPITLLIAVFLCIQGYSQAPPLPPTICKEFKPSGWIFFHETSISTGQLFTTHKPCFFSQQEDSMCLDRTWTDNWLELDHYHYQQKYSGIPVEGCEFTEHAKSNGSLVYANGKICPNIHTIYKEQTISEEVALDKLLALYPDAQWSWESEIFEEQLQADLADSNATSYPSGELVFTSKSLQTVWKYQMDASDFIMAWRFDVISLLPNFNVTVWVDAVTGMPFKMLSNTIHDGPADIQFYGTQILDTRISGGDAILHTNNGTVDVHTKYDGAFSWGLTSNVKDDDDDWGTSEQGATAVHWAVTQTWRYFQDTHGRDGIDDNGGKVRVFAESSDYPGAWFQQTGIGTSIGLDRLFAGYFNDGVYAGELTIMAHEFTHGVDHRSGKLVIVNESGALDESFADIFGFLTRRYATGIEDWEIGPPTTLPRNRRDLQFPNTLGIHYDITFSGGVPVTTVEGAGQPDTYEGDFWHPYTLEGTDNGGVHVNSGVQNHWFYVLSKGETGTNDIGDSYSVAGIGIDEAAAITYYNLTSNMQNNSQYVDAREGAVAAAMLFYGECSFEHIMTENAWYAVGVGSASSCANAGIEDQELRFEFYPNPSSDKIYISLNKLDNYDIKIYASNGQLVLDVPKSLSNYYEIDISELSGGTYILTVQGEELERAILIKQ